MKRVEAIQRILNNLTDECVITSCGMISREAYQIKDRPRNLYLMSAMGSELALGIGLAYTRPDLKVIVISGDGSALMGFGAIELFKYLYYEKDLTNLHYYLLDNGCYATTGGQPTCLKPTHTFQFSVDIFDIFAISPEKGDAPRISLTPTEITRRFRESIRKPQ